MQRTMQITVSSIQNTIESLLGKQHYASTINYPKEGSYIKYAYEPEDIFYVKSVVIYEYGEYGNVDGDLYQLVAHVDSALMQNYNSNDWPGLQIGQCNFDLITPVTMADIVAHLVHPSPEIRGRAALIARQINEGG